MITFKPRVDTIKTSQTTGGLTVISPFAFLWGLDELGLLQALSHPYQTKGPVESFGAIKVKAGFYVRVDMPGVTKETVSVRMKDGHVLFAGEAGMDSNQVESGRGILLCFVLIQGKGNPPLLGWSSFPLMFFFFLNSELKKKKTTCKMASF